MRLGAPLFPHPATPEAWLAALAKKGYRAAYAPCDETAAPDLIRAFAQAAEKNNIVISEVGAWGNNPLSLDEATRKQAVANTIKKLAFADELGARCCVNIAGSCVPAGGQWDGPAPGNVSDSALDLIVTSAREIIDAVKPRRACYVLETMPYTLPDGPEEYLRIFRAIDRKGFAVHFDPVNMVNSPRRYYDNAAFLRQCIDLLGPHIITVHAKDIRLEPRLTVHLSECIPGQGNLDYPTLLTGLARLNPDLPIMLEHLPTEPEYDAAAAHIRGVAATLGIAL